MMRVLFVEDEPNDYLMYISAVEAEAIRRGGELHQARTLEEALRCVTASTYDAIVLDLNIPLGAGLGDRYQELRLNGKYLLEHLHDSPAPPPRLVCLTNYLMRTCDDLKAYAGLVILPKSTRRDALIAAVFR
jgi:CheY-like chemotaxis protein